MTAWPSFDVTISLFSQSVQKYYNNFVNLRTVGFIMENLKYKNGKLTIPPLSCAFIINETDRRLSLAY